MKCVECIDYAECSKKHNLTIKRKHCPMAKVEYVQTNADRIRAMSDEELCDFLYSYKFFEMCKEGCGECSYQGECVRRLMEWLKQPAEE